MKKLYIMCGVAFSGKSTLAKKIAENKKAVLVSQDELWFKKREELNLDWDNDEDWDMVVALSKEKIREVLMSGSSVVYDDISLSHESRESLSDIAKECGAEAVIVHLDISKELQKERQEKSLETKDHHEVPEHLIKWGWEELEVPNESEKAFVFKPETDITDWLNKLP